MGVIVQETVDAEASGAIFTVEAQTGFAGGCIVEAPDQIVDASVESRLAAARDAVAGALDRDHDPALDDEDEDQAGAAGKAEGW